MKKQKSNNNLSDIELHQTNNVQKEKPEPKTDTEHDDGDDNEQENNQG